METECPTCGNSHAVKCYKCNRPALFLCDAVIDPNNPFQDTYLKTDPTCDRPMCEHHKYCAGAIIVCRNREPCSIVTRDYCEEHKQMAMDKGYYLYPQKAGNQ